jgi:hypothetical protein
MLKYLWANILGAILFTGINIAVFVLKREKFKSIRKVILLIVCIVLLTYKTAEYAYYQIIGMNYKIPMEFSQAAYFVFPLSVFLSKKTKALLPIGSFIAILSGMFFAFSWILSAKTFFERDTVYQLITATVFHYSLYFGGMTVLTTSKLPDKKPWQLPLGVGVIIGWHYLMHAVVDNDKDVILKNICEAKILDFMFPGISGNTAFKIIYYILIAAVFFGLIVLFYYLNRRFTYPKRGLPPATRDISMR